MKLLILVFSSLVLFCSCRTARIKVPTLEEYEKLDAIQVTFRDLINNKSKYHGQIIETFGFYSVGFERSQLVLDTIPFDWTKSEGVLLHHVQLWIEFHPSYYDKLDDSLNRRFVVMKGIFDTTRHGHLDAYFAELRDVLYARNKER